MSLTLEDARARDAADPLRASSAMPSNTCLVSVLGAFSPLKGTSPVSISYKMQPSAYWSTR